MTNKIVDGVVMPLTAEEQAEFDAPMLIEKSQELGVNQLKEIRVSRAFGGYSYKSQFFGKDDNDCNNISKTGFAIAGGIFALGTSTGGYWKNTSGERVLFVNGDFVEMATGLAMFQLKNRQGYHDAKDALATAETEQEINAIIEAYRNFDPSV